MTNDIKYPEEIKHAWRQRRLAEYENSKIAMYEQERIKQQLADYKKLKEVGFHCNYCDYDSCYIKGNVFICAGCGKEVPL